MELTNVRKWGRGQPLLVRYFAQMVVVSCEACLALRELVRQGCGNKVWELPPPAEWVRLYRQHRRVRKVVLESFWPTEDGKTLNATFMEEAQAEIRLVGRMSRAQVHDLVAGMDREAYREGWKLWQELLATMDVGNLDEFDTPTGEARVHNAFGRPEFVFYMLVWFPCWLEYGEHAPRLMRQARQGDIGALEKVLWLDKNAIHDPGIAREWQEASQDRNGARFRLLHEALGDGPKVKATSQKLKVRLAALISAVSESVARAVAATPGGWRVKKLTTLQIRDLFDALARDRGRGLVDDDLPESPESFAKALQREKDWCRFLIPRPGQK